MRPPVPMLALLVLVSLAAPARADAPAGAPDGGPAAAALAGYLPPEAVNKLSPEQIVEIMRDREHTARVSAGRSDPGEVAGPLSFFLGLALCIGLVQLFRTRREAARQHTLQVMVEKGVAIPPELLVPQAPPPNPDADLRRGLVLLGAGAGIAVFFLAFHPNGMPGGLWSLGTLPGLIGGGFLLAWRISLRRRG